MLKIRVRLAAAALIGIACSAACYAESPAATMPLADVDRVVARAMQAFAVPGLAVGVVKDGRVVLAKGYGLREMGKPAVVDADTVFAIGSNTKAFTTAALALLVDSGKLSWDDKVVERLPQFRVRDAYVTRELTIRDLLTHRSGLGPGAGDLLVFPDADFTRSEIMGALRDLPTASSFRSRFAYNNVLYMVAGEVIPSLSGSTWEEFVQRRLLDALDMKGCDTSGAKRVDGRNVAAAHAVVDGRLRRVEPVDVSVIAAAGGIHCNVSGMLKWMGMQLGDGPLISAQQRREMWTPQTLGPVSPLLTKLHGTHFRAYGLGWNLEDFHDYQRVFHSGGLLGMASHVTLLPELQLGIVVLSNQQSSQAVNALTLRIAKAYVGTGQQDWVSLLKAAGDEEDAQRAAAEAELTSVLAKAGAAPRSLDAYVGTYRDAWRGNAEVVRKGDALVLTFSRTRRLAGPLEHYRDEAFVVRWRDRSLNADAFVRFAPNAAGAIDRMTLESLPTSAGDLDFQDLDFHRIGPAADRQ